MVNVRSRARLVLGPLTLVVLSACDLTAPTQIAPATFTVTGVITGVTPEGIGPVSGVTVVESQGNRQVLTAENGRYTLPGMRLGSLTLKISKAPFVPTARTMQVTSDVGLDIQISQRLFTLSGVVTENTPAGPVPLADVEVWSEECPQGIDGSLVEAVTDANGLYTITGMCYGENTVFVFKPGYDLPKTTPLCLDHFGTVCRSVTILGNTRLDLELVRQ